MKIALITLLTVLLVSITIISVWKWKIIKPHTTSCISQNFEKITSTEDKDQDGIDDQNDILQGAKERTAHQVKYIDKYYSEGNGKPPDNEGVCTDLFWRALLYAGYDMQNILYQDMKENLHDYPLHIWNTKNIDKNIDFRRVPNLETYLKKYTISLSTEVIPCNYNNLNEWQGGDIVIMKLNQGNIADHIAIVSDRRDNNGVPYLIHNYGLGEIESKGNNFLKKAIGHYRFK